MASTRKSGGAMKHFIYTKSDNYPIVLLIKASAFNTKELEETYTKALISRGISEDDLLICELLYNEAGKAPDKFIKEHLETVLPAVDSVGAKYIYCADAKYFKVLTKAKKADAHLGYVLPCRIEGYEHLSVILGVNHKSLLYNPANEAKLVLSIDTLTAVVQGNYQSLGGDIIKKASYPTDTESIKLALQDLHQYDDLSADLETGSLDFDKAGIGTITFCWNKHEGIAFPCDYRPFADGPRDGLHGELIPNPEVRALLKTFLETYQGTLRWHNAPYDLKILIYELWMEDLLDTNGLLKGLEILTERFHDTKVIAYLATNSAAGNKLSLKELAHEFAGNWAQSDDDIKDIRRIPLPELLKYNLIDGLSTNYVFEKYYRIMVHDQQEELYYNLMMPSQKTIIQIELTGMPMDPVRVQEVRKELENILVEQEAVFSGQNIAKGQALISEPILVRFERRLQQDAMVAANAKLKVKQHPIEHFAEVCFNPNSGPQKQKLLYEEMGLPVIDFTKAKQPATGGETLEKLINHTDVQEYKDIIAALIVYAKAAKVLSSFIPAFEAAIDKGDMVVYLHGSFNLGGTVSGRLSSSDPNLQNIPAGSTYGKLVKSCFRAPKGWLFAGADFNSLEDYISALTTKDPNKLKVYLEGYDGHCLRAFGYFPEQLPGIVDTVESINSIKKLFPEVRQDSKAPTFLLTYRGTHFGLMNNLGWSKEKSVDIEDRYHDMYQVSDEWVADKLEEASKCGYVTVAFGLRLRTPLLHKTILGHKTTPYAAESEGRTAGNALGQSYGLLNNRAVNAFMKKVWASPYRFDIKPIALIHDAIYLMIRDDINVVEWVNRELIKAMQWQELPELEHDEVKLGAELSIFWPNWSNELSLPNDASQDEIRTLCRDFKGDYMQKKVA
jgi:Schitoviridae DNA polymerase